METAVEKYKELKPDLVTMDIHMPKMDGLAAVEQGEYVRVLELCCGSYLGEESFATERGAIVIDDIGLLPQVSHVP